MGSAALLEIEGVSVRRDGRLLVDDVSIDIAPQTIHLLVGPNGAGKSTLFNAVLGRVEFSGSIRFHWRRGGRLGYVPQSFVVDPTLPLTVGEFLALSRQRRPVCFGIARALATRLETLLARVGLDGFLERPLGGLSGGELQRVLLANALDPVPELLLLDEPIGGLDESASRQFEEVLLEQRATEGTSTFMVSHDLGHVRRIADHVTVLEREVRRSGPPALVLADDLASSLSELMSPP